MGARAPSLPWYVSQQPPPDDESVHEIDVTVHLEAVARKDEQFIHVQAFHLPKQGKKLVLEKAGIVALGEFLAQGFLERQLAASLVGRPKNHPGV